MQFVSNKDTALLLSIVYFFVRIIKYMMTSGHKGGHLPIQVYIIVEERYIKGSLVSKVDAIWDLKIKISLKFSEDNCTGELQTL